MNTLLHITVYGPQQPNAIEAFTNGLNQYPCTLIDLELSSRHNQIFLTLIIKTDDLKSEEALLKDLQSIGHKLGLTVNSQTKTQDATSPEAAHEAYILTVIGHTISAQSFRRLAELCQLHQFQLTEIKRLSASPESQYLCYEIQLFGPTAQETAFRAKLMNLTTELGIDAAFQQEGPFRKNRRLICFDMDSTLIQTEVIDELAAAAGVGEQVKAITKRAMQGELDFTASFRERVALLKGLPESTLQEIADRLPITEGAERLIRTLRTHGYKTAILSGGFQYFAKFLQQKLKMDYVFANQLPIADGAVTGEIALPVVDGDRKAEMMKQMIAELQIDPQQVIAVGDGANDLPMLKLAGLGIAFHAKPLVKSQARQALDIPGLDAILYLLGFREQDML